MLPPLPLTSPPPGTPHPVVVLPLPGAPQGERAGFTPAPVPAAPQGVVQLPGGADPAAVTPLPPHGTAPRSENAPRPEAPAARLTLPDVPTPAPAPPGAGATAMSLVAAQMQAGGTAAMQVLLAQQAAVRALPGTERPHAALHEAAAPEDEADHPLTLALPSAQTETQERHIPGQIRATGPRPHGTDPPDEEDIAAAIARRFPPIAPPANPVPGPGSPWLFAGAIFTALFLVAVLSL